MPRDMTRVTYDENGGMVTQIPKGTPKEEMEKARKEGRVDKNDPAYSVEDAQEDAERNAEAEKKNTRLGSAGEDAPADRDSRNEVETTEDVRAKE